MKVEQKVDLLDRQLAREKGTPFGKGPGGGGSRTSCRKRTTWRWRKQNLL